MPEWLTTTLAYGLSAVILLLTQSSIWTLLVLPPPRKNNTCQQTGLVNTEECAHRVGSTLCSGYLIISSPIGLVLSVRPKASRSRGSTFAGITFTTRRPSRGMTDLHNVGSSKAMSRWKQCPLQSVRYARCILRPCLACFWKRKMSSSWCFLHACAEV